MSLFSRVLERLSATLPQASGSGTSDPSLLLEHGWGGRQIRRGLPRVNHRSALSHGTVFACVNVIAQDMATIPLHLYRRTNGDPERVRDHPAARLMTIGDEEFGVPATAIRYGLQFALGLRGNAFAHIRRDGRGDLIGLDLIDNDRVQILTNGRERFYDFEDAEGVQRRAGWRHILHLRHGALDGWTGRSPIEMAAETLAVALGAQEFAGRHVSGDGVIKGVVEHPDWFQDDDEARRHAKRIRASLDDPAAKGIPILPYGMSYRAIGMSPADAQLLEQRRFDREQIAAVFRVPPAKVGLFEYGLKSSVEQQAIDYVTDCLLGWAQINQRHMALYLLTKEERKTHYFEYLFDGLMRATTRERMEALVKAVGGPFLSRNEARAMENRGKIAGADKLLPPPNMASLEGEDDDEED